MDRPVGEATVGGGSRQQRRGPDFQISFGAC